MYIEPVNLPQQNRYFFLKYQENELNKKHTKAHFNASNPKINNLLQPTTVLLIEQARKSKAV